MPNSSSVLEEVDEKAGLAFRNVFQSDYWIPDLKAGKPEWIADHGTLAMHTASDKSENVTLDIIPFIESLKKEVDEIHSLAVMVLGTAKSTVSSIGNRN